jgi:hypothetical protein
MEHMTQYKYTPESAGVAALRLYTMIARVPKIGPRRVVVNLARKTGPVTRLAR